MHGHGHGHGYPPDDPHDSRPMKRARNVSVSAEQMPHSSGSGLPMEDYTMGSGMTDSQRQPRSEGIPAPGGTSNRGRVDDKNNRKLSCKECRRYGRFRRLQRPQI